MEPRSDFPRRQVSRGRDELHPERHGPLPSVGEFQDGAAGQGAVVDEVEDAHLVEVEDHLEFRRGDDVEALVPAVDVGQAGNEPRLLDLHLLEDVLDDFANLPDGFGDVVLAEVNAVAVELVHLEHELGLRTDHVRGNQHFRGPIDVTAS